MGRKIHNSKFAIHNLLLLLLLLIYVFLALGHAYLAPLTTGPDELAHYEYVRFIADHDRLPLDYQERAQASYKSDQPPLYHLIAALPAGLVDPSGPPFLKRTSDNLRRQLIERTRHAWGLYNTEDELWPYRGEVLRWQVGRWVAILFGAATVAATYVIARGLFADGWLALGAAGVVAFIPRFVLTGSMLNYETTVAFFAALFLGVLLRIAGQGSKVAGNRVASSMFRAILLGLFMGLALTTKLSALILPLETLAALWMIKRYWGRRWGWWLRTVAVTAGAALVAVSWWFGFILYQFNTVAADGLWAGLLRPLIAADASDATTNRLLSFLTGGQVGYAGAIDNLEPGPPWRWAAIFFRTFWTVGIEGQQPLGWFGLALALILCLVAAYGLVLVWRDDRRRPIPSTLSPVAGQPADHRNYKDDVGQSIPYPRLILSLLLLHLAAAFVLPLGRYIATASLADTAQGRHVLFLTAPAFAILLVWGFSTSTSRITHHALRIRAQPPRGTHHVSERSLPVGRFIPLIPGILLLAWSGVQLWTMSWAYLPPLPVRTVPEAKAQADHLLDRSLNEYVSLVGYNRELQENGLLRVELIWQATAVSPVDFLTEVSLVDAHGDLRAQWLGYPAGGRYPTRAWDVGDIVRDTAWLPAAGLEPDEYQLNLNLVPTGSVPVETPASSLAASPLMLGAVTLPDLPPPAEAEDVQIWQDGERVNSPQTFGYRETIQVTLPPALAGQARQVQIVRPGPEANLAFDPVRDLGQAVLFIVGPDWPTGEYRVRVTPRQNGEVQVTSEPLIRVIDRWERLFELLPISHPVAANFANQVKLLGYDLAANRAGPGGAIPLTLYWQGLAWMGDDYTVFTKLLAADGSSHGGRDRRPQEGYSTLYWAPGEVVVDPFGVPVAKDTPNGVYYLNVGLYKQVGNQAISLPLVQDGRPIEATSINIGSVKIGDTPPEWVLETADPAVPLDQPFGETPNLTLLGYDLVDETGQPIPNLQSKTVAPALPGGRSAGVQNPKLVLSEVEGSKIQSLTLTLYWRSESPLPVDYTTFVHLQNEAGETVAQQDQPPLGGVYPTSLWDPGEIIADEISLTLPPELPPGEYSLVMGLYDFNTGLRLPVPGQPDNSLLLAKLRVAP